MQTNLHPIFQEALAPFAPLLNKDGTAASPAMAALFNTTYAPAGKKPRKSTDSFSYCLNGVDLECELDYEKASGDGWNEPRECEAAYLCEAWCGDTDIIELLSDEQREEIEIAYLEQDRSDV